MSTRTSRSDAIDAVRTNIAPPSIFPSDEAPGEVFGANVFSKSVMKQRLPKAIFASLMATIDHGESLDASVADVVAVAMKDWALEERPTTPTSSIRSPTSPQRSTTASSSLVATAAPSPNSRARP